MTQHRSPNTPPPPQGTEAFSPLEPTAPVAPTFHRPVPNPRQSLRTQRPVAQESLRAPSNSLAAQPGGQGPLGAAVADLRAAPVAPVGAARAAASAAPAPARASETAPQAPARPSSPPDATFQEAAFQDQAASHPAQAYPKAARRPAFPAAPSKVLAEQYALGGDGHIRDAEEAPAFNAPLNPGGPLLEGVYPEPPAQETLGRGRDPHTRATPRPDPSSARPRAQHAPLPGGVEPNLAESSAGEPYFGTPPHSAQPPQDGAFWTFAPHAQAASRSGGAFWGLATLVVLALLALLAWGAWAQLQNTTPALAVPPLRISATPGPERIIPEDRGGLQIADTDLGVLNPDAIQDDGSLAPPTPNPVLASLAPLGVTETGSLDAGTAIAEDAAVLIEEEVTPVTPAPETETVAGGGLPEFAPQPRPATIPVRQDLPVATPAPDPQPAPVASVDPTAGPAGPPVENSGIITVPPSQLYVQEGSYASLASAQSGFRQVSTRGGDLLTNIQPLYHRVEVNGQIRYRLYLIGFEDTLKAELVGARLGRNQDAWLIRNG